MEVRMRSKTLFLACCLLLWGHAMFAQRTTATLYGNVQDASNAVVPGAQVRITNEQTAAQFNARSDDRGDFAFTFVPLGRYRIEVEASGFKAFTETGIGLDAG